MLQQNEPQGATTRSRSRAGIRPVTTAPPEDTDTMLGAMPQSTAPEARANTVLEHPRPLAAIPDTSFNAIEGMTQTIKQQADALYPEAQAVSQLSSMNPIRLVSSALRSGLLSVQRDNNREMNRIMQSIEHCEQHVRNQADYIRRIDAASKKGSDSWVLQGCQLNSMVVSITDQGRRVQAVADSISELLALARGANTAIEEQATRLSNLQAEIMSFEERVFSLPEQEEPEAEEGELSPEVGAAQPQTPSFLRARGQPQTPYQRIRVQESGSSSPNPPEWPGFSR
jgi:hypothetical protein